VLAVAEREFGRSGLHGTSTEAIAERAGISQPYLFRLFGTKKGLFLACSRHCFERTRDTFRRAAEQEGGSQPADVLERMGKAYIELLHDRELLLLQLQTQAACDDDEVRAVAREGYGELWREVQRLSGAGDDEVSLFFATGMLLNVAAAMDVTNLDDSHPWAKHVLGHE
jgi:AcrR family transcriptional regulator